MKFVTILSKNKKLLCFKVSKLGQIIPVDKIGFLRSGHIYELISKAFISIRVIANLHACNINVMYANKYNYLKCMFVISTCVLLFVI